MEPPSIVRHRDRARLRSGDRPESRSSPQPEPPRHQEKFLADTDPGLASLAQLDRRQHIEPYLASMTAAVHSATGQPVTVADRARRVSAVASFLAEITEWGWPDAPPAQAGFPLRCSPAARPLPPLSAHRR
jgi:hypothetical protein